MWFGSQEAFENSVRSEIREVTTSSMISERTLFSNPRTCRASFNHKVGPSNIDASDVGFVGQAASEWTLPSEEVWQKSSLAFLVHGLICWS